jgi:hypothetical protein
MVLVRQDEPTQKVYSHGVFFYFFDRRAILLPKTSER